MPADDAAGRAAQEASFRRHIDLAKRLGKVLQIHDRDAHADVLRILAEEGAPERTVFHCFSGDADMARFCVRRGWYLSFAGTLTFKNAGAPARGAAAVPLDRVLVETDAPYLTPAPYRGRPNASYLVPLTVRCMAEVLDRELDDVCARLNATSEELYGAVVTGLRLSAMRSDPTHMPPLWSRSRTCTVTWPYTGDVIVRNRYRSVALLVTG